MASTTEHISIRLPKHIVDHLRQQAELEQRSLSWMIGYRLAQLSAAVDEEISHADDGRARGNAGDSTERTGHGASVPVLQPPASQEKRLHPVQSLRNELAQRGGHQQGPEIEPHATHNTYKAGERNYCSTCRTYF